ncbi:hypothetical protein NDU88_002054 [Pleurodeles waltl]|uniref:Uncharacterized protein n=1 Tax=Pleurodeles waltl TaxID=8319 RepID=A0AAV7TJN3_PLEWA|nr:hypothetical protein NDU88_002054 [Pleurodeles waltl]
MLPDSRGAPPQVPVWARLQLCGPCPSHNGPERKAQSTGQRLSKAVPPLTRRQRRPTSSQPCRSTRSPISGLGTQEVLPGSKAAFLQHPIRLQSQSHSLRSRHNSEPEAQWMGWPAPRVHAPSHPPPLQAQVVTAVHRSVCLFFRLSEPAARQESVKIFQRSRALHQFHRSRAGLMSATSVL